MSQPPPRAPLPRLGSYEIEGLIAEGGMASVFVARRGGERVALKTIREDFGRNQEFLEMFLEEARLVAMLRHPAIVQTYESGIEQGQAFIAMELLAGQSLLSVWDACHARGVRLRYEMIAWIGARVAEGLHYAHELRDPSGRPLEVVHRDINPSNIFVTYDGAIKIIDFGLAKAANRAWKTAAGIIKGKVAYMSPEQAMGEAVDRRTDVFALGTTLWELCCDRRLFKGDDDVRTLELVHAARIPDARQLVAGFPPPLWAAIARALERDRAARFATAGELAAALDAFVGGAVTGATIAQVMRELFPGAPPPPSMAPGAGREAEALAPRGTTGRHLLPILLLIAGVVASVVIGALLLR